MKYPKSLLFWKNSTLIEYQVRCLFEANAAQVVVVLGYKADLIKPYLKGTGADIVINHKYNEGKTTSIKAGISSVTENARAILLLAVDQPRTSQIISTIIKAHFNNNALITSPIFQGKTGHPLIFDISLKNEIKLISEEHQGIRQVYQDHIKEVFFVNIDDPLIHIDLNTLNQYEHAKLQYGI